jgi:diaminohydroxyphosphoribosylaminopyrimidine deaminase/5-amino-6-(5-phosphoribosylamino)uracil reductase
VVVGAVDPNPRHRGKGLRILSRRGVQVKTGVLGDTCTELNEAFNHWIVHDTPFVTVKAAMTLDGKIATASGESKWITGARARDYGMKLRGGSDAILVGINTLLADDPSLTYRLAGTEGKKQAQGRRKQAPETHNLEHVLRRIVLDARARTPVSAKVVSDAFAALTTIVVSRTAPGRRVRALSSRVNVLVAPERDGLLDLRWLMRRLGSENVTSLLVEGGGEVNASFVFQHLAHRVVFFYAPKILGGLDSRRGVAGRGARSLEEAMKLENVEWRKLGADWLLRARLSLPLSRERQGMVRPAQGLL